MCVNGVCRLNFHCWLSVPIDGAGQRDRILGEALGGGAALLVLVCAAAVVLVWCRRRRMHQTNDGLAKGDESRTGEREPANGLVSQMAQARPKELQVRVPRLERVCRALRPPLSNAPAQSAFGQPLPVCQVGEHTCVPLCQRGVSCPRGSSM